MTPLNSKANINITIVINKLILLLVFGKYL